MVSSLVKIGVGVSYHDFEYYFSRVPVKILILNSERVASPHNVFQFRSSPQLIVDQVKGDGEEGSKVSTPFVQGLYDSGHRL